MAGAPHSPPTPPASRAFADLSAWTKGLVEGEEARSWLGDLVTADVAGLEPGRAARSLLLSPTGRIRADFTVARLDRAILLMQAPDQPHPIDRLLAPYVLGSDVALLDRTETLGVVGFPGEAPPPDAPGHRSTPSAVGTGVDLIADGSPDEALEAARAVGMEELDPAALERWRIERGAARFPVDLTEASLPHEAALDHAIDHEKGCYLGQEAVAKVRNLGHPPRVVLAARSGVPVAAGAPVLAGGREVGSVTSVATLDGGAALILWVRWDARDEELATPGGPLEIRGPASGRP